MELTGNKCSGSDIWLEFFNQGIYTKDIILTTWYKKVMK